MENVDALITRLRTASLKERELIKAELLTLASAADGFRVRDHLEVAKRQELLEIQWEIEEVIEATAPKKVEAPKPVEPPAVVEETPDPTKPLTAKDLVLVYDDPRGLMVHKSKVGERWVATQVDPRTGQPQSFELHAQEVVALKQQLAGSPYWLVGGPGVVTTSGMPKPPARPGPRG